MSLNESLDTARDKLLARAAPGRAEFEDLVVVPLFAVVVALVLGALTMLATGVDLSTIGRSYVALLQGSVGSINALSETLTAAIPLVLAGLGLALGFRTGLFNIGAEGQLLMGGLAAVIFGFTFEGLPFAILMPLSLLAGALMGAFYAGIAGYLRAATGAHEVISTIMLNLISYRILDYMLSLTWIQREGRSDPVSRSVPPNAELPRLLEWLDPNLRVHAGIFVMLLAVVSGSLAPVSLEAGFRVPRKRRQSRCSTLCGNACLAHHRAGHGDRRGTGGACAVRTRCSASSAARRRGSPPGSGLMRSPSRFWVGRTRSAFCSPGFCSAHSRPGGGRCRSMQGSRSTLSGSFRR